MRLNDSGRFPLALALALIAAACGEAAPPKAAPPPPAPSPAAEAQAPTPPPPAPPPQAAAPAPAHPAAAPAPKAPAAAPAAKPPAPATAAAPARPAQGAAAEPVREKLGAGQCRSCHRLQYDSWVKSGHARKALDCEGCHGNGSEYATMAVMKDPARAKAAGLIFQTAAFCDKCHPTADDSFLPKAHAHKKKK